MNNVTVDSDQPSLYLEPDTFMYRFKRKLMYTPVLKILKEVIGDKDEFSLLEIGSGSGFLLKFLEEGFPNATLLGIEYHPELVDACKNKYNKAKVIQGNAEEFDLGGQQFDIIISLQVIEHLYKPELMLQNVKKHLKHNNGTFIFTTPNLGCYSEKVMRQKWHGYRPDHVSLKDVDGWQGFAERNGFKAIKCKSTFFSGIPLLNKFPLGVINWSLLYFVGSMKWKLGESFIGIFKLNGQQS